MPLQNRVLPNGLIVADPNRGTFMGNRGILHRSNKKLGTSRWKHKAWVCCVLSFKNRKRSLMAPHNYTELFFLDEATALAAGHRPCAECRRADYLAYVTAWTKATGQRPSAPQMDATLHPARVTRSREQVTFQADPATLPSGTMIQTRTGMAVVWNDAILVFTTNGYATIALRPTHPVTVLTPRPTVAALTMGYIPRLHPSAIPYIP